MSAAVYDIVLEQGSDFEEEIKLTLPDRTTPAMNLTGCTIESKLFKSGALVSTFDCTVLDGPASTFTRKLSHSVVDTLEASQVPKYVHTLNIVFPDGAKKRIFKGKAGVSAEGV